MAWYNGSMDIESTCAFCSNPVVRRKQAESRNVKLHFCDMDCKANYQKLRKPVTKEWLEEHYLNQKLDTTQIGRLVHRDPKSVWNWLKDFGIPTRPRGGATAPKSFISGQPNAFKGHHHTPETKAKLRSISLADGRVPYNPAVGSYMKGRKGKDTTNWKGGITPERQALYSSLEWGEAVKAVWKRDNGYCQRCGKRHNEPGVRGTFHIHHIMSFAARELRANPDNLILLCKSCHRFVHSKKNVNKEWLANG